MGNIINDTGLDKGTVGKYLSVLTDLHLVEREVPITERNPARSRKGIYRLTDHYFRFWFRFVFPYIREVEQDRREWLFNRRIKPALNEYVGPVFERIAGEVIETLDREGRLPLKVERFGRWWEKEEEIDVVAFGDRGHLYGEFKWSEGVDGEAMVRALDRKADKVGLEGARHYLLVARSFRRRARGAIHIDLKALGRVLSRAKSPR